MNNTNNPSDPRYFHLCEWLDTRLSPSIIKILPLANDASFRRFFRIQLSNRTLIAMDAPPDKENSRPFVKVAEAFQAVGLVVPDIIAVDLHHGFMLLTDLGDDLYSRVLTPQNADQLYKNAIEKLFILQSCSQDKTWHFPAYDRAFLTEELKRFREWYLIKHLDLTLTSQEENMLAATFEQLVHSAHEQPQLCIHRDYHSRNLLALANNEVGILDFQDAAWGPITYDVVSLLRDCYIQWSAEQVEQWALYYYYQALTRGSLSNISAQQFMRWFDWMGIQRHLKILYIFTRKLHRDQNAFYLGDIPRTLNYILQVTQPYSELQPLKTFLATRVLSHESNDSSGRSGSTSASAYRRHT